MYGAPSEDYTHYSVNQISLADHYPYAKAHTIFVLWILSHGLFNVEICMEDQIHYLVAMVNQARLAKHYIMPRYPQCLTDGFYNMPTLVGLFNAKFCLEHPKRIKLTIW